LSVGCIVVVPLFPIFVECVKNEGHVRSESFLLTAAVMAAGYGFASEDDLARAAYLVLFLASIGFDFKSSDIMLYPTTSPAGAASPWQAGYFIHLIKSNFCVLLLVLTSAVQTVERLSWHVILDRRFPDWVKKR